MVNLSNYTITQIVRCYHRAQIIPSKRGDAVVLTPNSGSSGVGGLLQVYLSSEVAAEYLVCSHLAPTRQLSVFAPSPLSWYKPSRAKEPLATRMSETPVYITNVAYTMGTISTRIPDNLERELEEYFEEERLDRSTAVRKLLSEGLEEWRREQALKRLAADEISFTKAAQLAEMSVWEFAQLAKKHDITWVSGDHLEDDLEDL